jgi:hypothetical protein
VPDGVDVDEAEALPEDVVAVVDEPPPHAPNAPAMAATDATAAQPRKLIFIVLLPSDARWTSPVRGAGDPSELVVVT